MSQHRNSPPWKLIISAVILAVLGAWGAMYFASRPERVLKIQAERVILESLAAPSTAKITTTNVKINERGAIVEGYVDAQNGFGAAIRKDWFVAFERDGEKFAIIKQMVGDKKIE